MEQIPSDLRRPGLEISRCNRFDADHQHVPDRLLDPVDAVPNGGHTKYLIRAWRVDPVADAAPMVEIVAYVDGLERRQAVEMHARVVDEGALEYLQSVDDGKRVVVHLDHGVSCVLSSF